MRQEEMTARKDARDLEATLKKAFEAYLRHADSALAGSSDEDEDDPESRGPAGASRLEIEVQSLLDKLAHQIEKMEAQPSSQNSITWRAQISRLESLLASSSLDFKKTKERVRQKRESRQLLKSSASREPKSEQDESAERLYGKEREIIGSASRAMDEHIGTAMAVQDMLKSQKDRIARSTQGVLKMAENIPAVNTLIKAAQKKKTRDNMIVAGAIALGLCFILWFLLGS